MADWSAGSCETNGINVHYKRTGGSNPPVILLHGLTANGACWAEIARAIESDFDVIMPDGRGHGKSIAPEWGYRYEDLANDVVGLIEALHLSRPSLVGHSMGGVIAAVVARYFPDLLQSVVLADPTFISPKLQQEVWESTVVNQHQRYLNMSLEDIMADARDRHPDRSIGTIERMAQARRETAMKAFDILTPPIPDYLQIVPAIRVPSLLVIGGTAGLVSPDVAADLQRLNPHLQVEQIPDVGHGLHYDQPGRFAAVVKSFLRSLEPAQGGTFGKADV